MEISSENSLMGRLKERKYLVFISSPNDKKNAVTHRDSILYRE
jgi:hypothetical protein